MTEALASLAYDLGTTVSSELATEQVMPAHREGQVCRFYMQSVLGTVISLIGIIGSCISFIVLSQDKHSKVAAFLLQSLCIADSFFLVLEMINVNLTFAFEYHKMAPESQFHRMYIHPVVYPLEYIAELVAIWITVLIAGIRFIAVCSPLHARRLATITNARYCVAAVTTIATLVSVPRFLETLKITYTRDYNVTLTRELAEHPTFSFIYLEMTSCIIYFIVPVLLLIYFNARLIHSYRTSKAVRHKLKLQRNNEDEITLTMILVVVVFIILQMPLRMMEMVWDHTDYFQEKSFDSICVSEFFRLLIVVNSSVNFFIYCGCRRQFRWSLRRYFCKPGAVNPGEPTDTLQTIREIKG